MIKGQKVIPATNFDEKILVREVWDKPPREIELKELKHEHKHDWRESITWGYELTDDDLKNLPDDVRPIDDDGISKLRAQSKQSRKKVSLVSIDKMRGKVARVEDDTIPRTQCISAGGGFYSKEELHKDYAFILKGKDGKKIISYSPQDISAYFMHGLLQEKHRQMITDNYRGDGDQKFEPKLLHMKEADIDPSVDREKLNSWNVYGVWFLYQKRYIFRAFFAVEDLRNVYLTVHYGRDWFYIRNIVFDFFYKQGPMLDPTLHHKTIKLMIHTTPNDDGVAYTNIFDRAKLRKDLDDEEYRTGFRSSDQKAICMAKSKPIRQVLDESGPRRYYIVLPSAAIDYWQKRGKNTNQGYEVARKLREATADAKYDIEPYKQVVEEAKKAKVLDGMSTNGNTALHWAIQTKQPYKVHLLLVAGADRMQKLEVRGKSAAEFAEEKGINLDELLKNPLIAPSGNVSLANNK